MSEDVIAQGLHADRYVKAVRLAEEFETAVFATISDVLDVVTAGPAAAVFDQQQTYSEGRFRTPGPTCGTLRLEAATTEINPDGNRLMLNMGLEWVTPEAQGLQNWPDPLLRYAYYKIRHAPAELFETVAIETQESTEYETIRVGTE